MKRSRLKSSAQNKLALEALSPIELRRRSLATASHLPVPRSAQLSVDGVLSWKWHSPARLTSRSAARQYRTVESMLWRKFAALSLGSDENIRKFTARWGPLYARQTETVAEWRQLAT